MLNLKVLIENDSELIKTLDKSKKKRYKLLKKNKNYIVKSKKIRERQLDEPYPTAEMKICKKRFKLLCNLMKLRTMLDGVRVIEYNSYKKQSDKPVIFVPTHIGKFDIEVVYECINEHALLLSGTEDRMHGTLDGYFLEKNGVNYVDRSDKDDRGNSLIKQKRDLENGVNLLWFVEGTWNLSPNQLIYEISYSIVKLALETDVEIVPIGLNQVGKNIYVNFGQPYKPDSQLSLIELIQQLRDKLATLKWELYEYNEANNDKKISVEEYKKMENKKYYYTKRADLPDDYWADFVNARIKEWPITDLMEECKYVFKHKDDAHSFFEEFNTRVAIDSNGKRYTKRI